MNTTAGQYIWTSILLAKTCHVTFTCISWYLESGICNTNNPNIEIDHVLPTHAGHIHVNNNPNKIIMFVESIWIAQIGHF